jgi:hypothetical protein
MIADLIASGQAKIQDEQQRRLDDDRKRKEEQLIEIVTQEAELERIVADHLPEAVLPYVGLCSELPLSQSGEVFYRIEAPECTAVSFKIKREWVTGNEAERGYHFTGLGKCRPHEYAEERYCSLFEVECLGVVETEDDGFVVGVKSRWHCDDVEVALGSAHLQYARRAELQAEADRKNEKRAELQARAQSFELQKASAQAKADAQLAEMMDDPIMWPLLNLVNAIMRERADTNQRISDLHEAMETTEYYHSEAASRLEKRVSDEARRRSEAEREAESARYEASEAEDKLRKAKKRTGVWGG